MNPTVNKQQLLETLRKNRERHVQIVKEAAAGYREHARRLLSAELELVNQGEQFSMRFDLTPPRNYTEQYDAAIAMLEWNKAEEIELTEAEFSTFVLDKWRWGGEFYGAAAGYSGTAAAMFANQ